MFKYRAISFPILLALLFYMVAYADKGGIYVYTACAALMIGLAVYELGAMTRKIGFKNFPVISGIAGAMLFSGFAFIEFSAIIVTGIICILFLLTIMAPWLFLLLLNNRNNKVVDADKGLVEYSPEKTDYLLSVLGSVGITVILAIPLLFTAVTYFRGVFLFLFLALVTKAMDTGGYIFGKLSVVFFGGNHKICPTFSPKKSWEGTVGGLIFSVGTALLFYKYNPVIGTEIWKYIVCGIVLGLGSFAGDLTESAVKRICGVKDSNHIIPGMGGAFDVLDSFIYNGIIFTLLLIVFGGK